MTSLSHQMQYQDALSRDVEQWSGTSPAYTALRRPVSPASSAENVLESFVDAVIPRQGEIGNALVEFKANPAEKERYERQVDAQIENLEIVPTIPGNMPSPLNVLYLDKIDRALEEASSSRDEEPNKSARQPAEYALAF